MKIFRHLLPLLLAAALLIPAAFCGSIPAYAAEPTESEASGDAVETAALQETACPQGLSAAVTDVNKYGNVSLDVSAADMNAADMEVGDIITVTAGSGSWAVPVCSAFMDVDSGSMICILDPEDGHVTLGIYYGSFAEETGIAVKETAAEEPGWQWKRNADSVLLSLKEKGGYADEFAIRNLQRTNERGDYPDCTDEEFANFYAVSVTGIRPETLYRSSSPLDDQLGRSAYAMAAMEKAGIRAVLNLVDTASETRAYAAWEGSYYSSCEILNAAMGVDFSETGFDEMTRDCVRFIGSTDGPYLVHCLEGRDRTGILCAILECYAGAPYEEIVSDFMLSYQNFFRVQEGSATYNHLVDSFFKETLSQKLAITDPETADLQQAAEAYLLRCGLSDDDLLALRQRIMT